MRDFIEDWLYYASSSNTTSSRWIYLIALIACPIFVLLGLFGIIRGLITGNSMGVVIGFLCVAAGVSTVILLARS